MTKTNLTPQQLTELAEQKPDDFLVVLYTACYGKTERDMYFAEIISDWEFNPLEKSERGRSQAFELAEKFDLDLYFSSIGQNMAGGFDKAGKWQEVINPDMQTAIGIAATLTAQELRK